MFEARFEAAQHIRFDGELPMTVWAKPAAFVYLPGLMELFSPKVPGQPPQAFPDLLVLSLSGYPQKAGQAWLHSDRNHPEFLRELLITLNLGCNTDDLRALYGGQTAYLDSDTLIANHLLLHGWPYIQRGLRRFDPRHHFGNGWNLKTHDPYEQFMRGKMQEMMRGEHPPIIDTRSLTKK